MSEARKLSKWYGSLLAVDDVSFRVERGEILGFLGPNGAGKTTTMRMLAGFISSDSGSAHVCGFGVSDDPLNAKACIGYLPEGAPLYGDMTPASLLKFALMLRGLCRKERIERINAVISSVELHEVLHRPIDTLSKGFKRRVALAQAIAHDPDVLILDEPTDGLDPNQKYEVRALLRSLARDKAIIISTHALEEVEALCTRAVVIAQGRIRVDDTPANLRMIYQGATMEDIFRIITSEKGEVGK